jgi:hypothetical protein
MDVIRIVVCIRTFSADLILNFYTDDIIIISFSGVLIRGRISGGFSNLIFKIYFLYFVSLRCAKSLGMGLLRDACRDKNSPSWHCEDVGITMSMCYRFPSLWIRSSHHQEVRWNIEEEAALFRCDLVANLLIQSIRPKVHSSEDIIEVRRITSPMFTRPKVL